MKVLPNALDDFKFRVFTCGLRLSLPERIDTQGGCLIQKSSQRLLLLVFMTKSKTSKRTSQRRHGHDRRAFSRCAQTRDKDVRLVVLLGARYIHFPPSALPELPQLPSRVIHSSKTPARYWYYPPVEPRTV